MSNAKNNRNTQSGYSLLGTALLVVTLGMMISVGLIIHKNYEWNRLNNTTNENLKTVYEALLRYRYEHNRLPCPAKIDEAIDSPTFGKEQPNCAGTATLPGHRGNGNVRYGAVPIRTLNLPDSISADGWEHRYTYAVTEYYTTSAPNLDIHVDKGAIRVIDAKGEDVTGAPGNVVFTVMSPGADKRGSYTLAGNLQAECDVNSPAGENCDTDNSVFMSSVFKQWDTSEIGDTYTTTMAYLASSKAYKWVAGNWSGCNCEAAVPTQTRTATCVDENNVQPYPQNPEVNDSFCAASSKPELTKECVAYCWDAGPWSPCECPASASTPSIVTNADGQSVEVWPPVTPLISTRIVYCRTNIYERVSEPFCRAIAKPETSRACGTSCGGKPPPTNSDPLIFDLTGDGISMKSMEEGVLFDMENNNEQNQTGWIHETNGFLIRDKNRNGRVDNQSEMFGTTGKPAFDELKEYDSNKDGDVTPEDKKWKKLTIWQDINGDGITQPGELRSLDYWGIRRIPLVHEDVFLQMAGNDVTGKAQFEQYIEGVGTVMRDVWEVFFSYFKKSDTENL